MPCRFLAIVDSDLADHDAKAPALFSFLPSQMVEEPVSPDGDEPGDRVGSSVIRFAMADGVNEGQLGELLCQTCFSAAPSEQIGVDTPGRDVVPLSELPFVGKDRVELASALRTPLLRTP
jgi:hypothetical protein